MSDRPRTLYEKIWDAHVIAPVGEDEWLLYVDRHFVHEVTSPQAFESLRAAGRQVRRPHYTLAVADHNIPTDGLRSAIHDEDSRRQVAALERNVRDFGIPYVPPESRLQGIVHVIGPELGLTLPGMTIVCGDSHTSTHGAFGTLAFGIGTSEVEHVLATQTIVQHRSKTMLIKVSGPLADHVTAKDLILWIIGKLGAAAAIGFAVEFGGEAIDALDMAGRMTVCNMAVELGARTGLIAPDKKTIAWLTNLGRLSEQLERQSENWLGLRSDAGAAFDRVIRLDAGEVMPMVTWGTSPEAVSNVRGHVPDPATLPPEKREQLQRMLNYMALSPNQPIDGIAVDAVFIGSCTNSRIEDLRAAATIARRGKVPNGVRALVVPGSGQVKAMAEAEGLDEIFRQAGFQWRESGCSMCLGMNPDRLRPGERCASTSNRNFEGRQGPGGRTHLMSPLMAAAAAIEGRITDVTKYL